MGASGMVALTLARRGGGEAGAEVTSCSAAPGFVRGARSFGEAHGVSGRRQGDVAPEDHEHLRP